MLQFVLAVFQSAFQRRLSRGGHFRSDATSTDDSFTHSHIFIGGEVHHVDTICFLSANLGPFLMKI